MRQVIIGFGEIGKAVHEVIFGGTRDETIYVRDSQIPDEPIPVGSVDVMHICFPYSDRFIFEVEKYRNQFRPEHLIVWSTTPIGTCEELGVVHTPVEGKHPDLELSIRQMERWIGTSNIAEAEWFSRYFRSLDLRTRVVLDSRFTEALKLLSTTEYGVNIEFARYKKEIADRLDMPYDLMKFWNEEYNRLYNNLGLAKKYQKFVLDAPDGPKGGHCVTPNARLLQEQYPNEMVKVVAEL